MAIQNSLNLTVTGVVSAGGDGTFTGSALTQHDVLIGGASNAIVSITPSTSGFALISNGTSSDPSFQAITQAGTWVVDSTTARTLTAGQNVAFTNASLATATLPSTAALGDTFLILTAGGAGGVKLGQAASQLVHFLGSTTTTGTGGSLQSLQAWSWVQVVCTTANTVFAVIGSDGSWTVT